VRIRYWLEALRCGWVRTSETGTGRLGIRRHRNRVAVSPELLESRVVLAEDFGDAPDIGAGTGAGNYETALANGGPQHTIVAGLFLGARVDGEADATQNVRANGDDSTPNIGPDDEDGVVNPQGDFLLTPGTQPTVTLRATNTTGTNATLSGWIDFNNNGVFDNASERAQVVVQAGTTNGTFTLTFPVVPTGFTGRSYARFRLSSDVAAANPTGAATNGEVEDYAVTITGLSSGTVKTVGASKLASGGPNMPTLENDDRFGGSVANMGDLNGDGVADLAVGAFGDDTGGSLGSNRGAVHILLLNADGMVISRSKIATGIGGAPALNNGDLFGSSVANVGDLDGDGVTDLAVGAAFDDTNGTDRGAVHVLFLKTDGTVKSSTKIASGTGGGPALNNGDYFGHSVANVGDLNGDGVADLAVGADGDDLGGNKRGAAHILFLNTNGTVKSSTKIAHQTSGGPTLVDYDFFGSSVANVGDLDGDGVADLAVGASADNTNGTDRGAVHLLFLNTDGTVKSSTKIASGANGGPTLMDKDFFGGSVANVGDLDGDGVADLAVGAYGDAGGSFRGAVHVLFLNASGTVKSSTKIASGTGGGPTLADGDYFGFSVTNVGDLDGDGVADLAVGAFGDNTGGSVRGAVHILRLNVGTALRDFGDAPDATNGTGAGNYQTRNGDSGPSHAIVNGLLLGTRISGETDATANTRANGDDIGIDDEDGVVNPQGDFLLTPGTQPTVTLRATNTTGTAATLSGWIDFNNNGVFDNASERAQISVPAGTNNGTFTLTFPVVPTGFTGRSYARFRLSSDAAAASPNGAATNGEVEDYAVTITGPSSGTVKAGGTSKLASGGTNMPTLADRDYFGRAVVNLGDLNGDGVADLAVGATGDDAAVADSGAVHILFLNASGGVTSSSKIANGNGGGPILANGDFFGSSVANVGDLDGDGVTDLAVGARGDGTGGVIRGAVHLLFLTAGGTVKSIAKIASGTSGAPALNNGDYFGSSVASVGDLDGDGVADLAVGATGDATNGTSRGAVHVLFLNASGTVKSSTKIASATGGGPALSNFEYFGSAVANVGDLDGDGVTDLAVGARGDDALGSNRGAVHLLFLNAGGTVKSSTKIASGTGGGPALSNGDYFGISVSNVGDLDGDGVADLAVGAYGDDTGGSVRGAVHVLFLNASGTVKSSTKIAHQAGGGPTLTNSDFFGRSVANMGDLDGDGVADLAVGADGDGTGGAASSDRGAVHILRLNVGTALRDFGDAPDIGTGTGAGNYQTTNGDSGPSHAIVNGLLLGTRISGETDATANTRANGDDIGIDDEDGVVNPQGDFLLTTGTQPTITLRATNTTGTAATLSGWIDTNNNGVFDNPGERAQIAVPAGTNNGTFTLTFPVVPTGFTGRSYARFRLSTDTAAQNPTGTATNGEVEDYAVTITGPSDGTVKTGGATKLASGGTNMPMLENFDSFGSSVANVGDLDGDGVADLAVGAIFDDTGGSLDSNRGAVHILFLNAGGTVKSSTKIASGTNGGPTLAKSDLFGSSVANVGDLDGDGVADLAVGARSDDTGGNSYGAVHVLFLKTDGTVKSSTKIASGTGGGPALSNRDYFGSSVANVGDLDGDGVTDLAVGALGDDTGGTVNASRGAVHILFLKTDGTVKSSTKIAHETSGGPTLVDSDFFGNSVANMGDLDGDGVADLAVGAYRSSRAVHILFLKTDGTVKSSTKIASGTNGGPTLVGDDRFGSSVANVGDLDGDGVADLAVGALRDSTGGSQRGAAHILFLNASGTVKSSTKIAHQTGGGPTLVNYDSFGGSVANVGDLDGDGVADLAVGADRDAMGGNPRGAVHILRLNVANRAPTGLALAPQSIAENSAIGTTIGTFTTTDPDAGNTFTYALVGGAGSTDNASFTISGNTLQSNAVFDFETKSSYAIRVRTTDQGGLSFEQTFTVSVTNGNDAPVLDASGNVFAILGVGSRQSIEMRQGTLVSDILARGAGGNPISDVDAGAQRGIAVIAADRRFGSYQFTLVTNNPQESDWNPIDANIGNNFAQLLPDTARIRFVTTLVPHHATAAQFLPLESKLDTGLTFRAWDQSAGAAGGFADTTSNGGSSAFSLAAETVKVYFEARLFRVFNSNAQLNVYTLEAEFNALTANPALQDRSTSAFTGFTILMSAVPELGTAPVFRMLYGVQFNADGTETDMGYRYLTTNEGEASFLEGLGRADKRPQRDGTYFREIGDPAIPSDPGVNNRTAILGYIFTTQQPGTQQMTQVYRLDDFPKPTRPGGTRAGSPTTTTVLQQQGDHVYTTNTAFETSRPGTWVVEANRGFVRELSPNPTGGPPPVSQPAVSQPAMVANEGAEVMVVSPVLVVDAASDSPVVVGASPVESVSRLIAVPVTPVGSGAITATAEESEPETSWAMDTDEPEEVTTYDAFFADAELVGASGWGL
jgi:hypothetical protein